MASPWPADLSNGYTAFSSSCSSELTNLSTEAPSDVGSRPALRPLLYGTEKPMRDPAARVHWDEECIAEHDKDDRGTRQKIDEPDTPFVRSPTGSDDEEEKSTSTRPAASPEVPEQVAKVDDVAKPRRTLSPDAMEMLTDRLNEWVEIGSPQSQGRRQSKEEEKSDRSEDSSRRVSVQVGDSKSSSSNFKAQRAKHYNEFAAMKAFKQQKFDSDSSAASDTSDEEALRRKQKKKGVKVETRQAHGDHQGELNSSSKDDWRTKRNAHYRDMAAAFKGGHRSAEEDSDSD